jgi:hypothetical protein
MMSRHDFALHGISGTQDETTARRAVPDVVSPEPGRRRQASITRRRAELAKRMWDLSKTPLSGTVRHSLNGAGREPILK